MARSPTPVARSRSPPRRGKPKPSGFRWKDKPRRDEGEAGKRGDEGGPQRGYRHERDGYRDRSDKARERSRSKDCTSRRTDEGDEDRRARRERKREAAAELETAVDHGELRQTEDAVAPPAIAPGNASRTTEDDIAAKFGPGARVTTISSATKASDTETPPARAAAPTGGAPRSRAPAGPMIVVKINDRLGTTSKVPCLASDTVGDFKKMVAMRIGRKPHEIMLKRQSERPFKDFLTLADYGVSDGVQLDLELDTGD